MSYDFFFFFYRMKYIKRWQLMRSVREENIMEHSQQVAMFAHALAVIKNRIYGGNVNAEKAVLYAVYHECAEVMTGDLPTPIKYFDNSIRGAYKNLEEKASLKLLSMLPKELEGDFAASIIPDAQSEEYAIMKAADRLAAYVKCLEELRCGNNEFAKAKKSIEDDLHSRNMPEVEYFFKNFIEDSIVVISLVNGK